MIPPPQGARYRQTPALARDDHCAAQFDWEATHRNWPDWHAADAWRLKTNEVLDDLVKTCRSAYTGAVGNIGLFANEGMRAAFDERFEKTYEDVKVTVNTSMAKKDAEGKAKTVRTGLGFAKAALIWVFGAASGVLLTYLKQRYFGQ